MTQILGEQPDKVTVQKKVRHFSPGGDIEKKVAKVLDINTKNRTSAPRVLELLTKKQIAKLLLAGGQKLVQSSDFGLLNFVDSEKIGDNKHFFKTLEKTKEITLYEQNLGEDIDCIYGLFEVDDGILKTAIPICVFLHILIENKYIPSSEQEKEMYNEVGRVDKTNLKAWLKMLGINIVKEAELNTREKPVGSLSEEKFKVYIEIINTIAGYANGERSEDSGWTDEEKNNFSKNNRVEDFFHIESRDQEIEKKSSLISSKANVSAFETIAHRVETKGAGVSSPLGKKLLKLSIILKNHIIEESSYPISSMRNGGTNIMNEYSSSFSAPHYISPIVYQDETYQKGLISDLQGSINKWFKAPLDTYQANELLYVTSIHPQETQNEFIKLNKEEIKKTVIRIFQSKIDEEKDKNNWRSERGTNEFIYKPHYQYFSTYKNILESYNLDDFYKSDEFRKLFNTYFSMVKKHIQSPMHLIKTYGDIITTNDDDGNLKK